MKKIIDILNIENIKSFAKKIKRMLLYALNPANALSESRYHRWYYYLIFPAVGWMFFFMQVGLDASLDYYVPALSIIGISLLGLVAGYVVLGLVSYFVTYILNVSKIEKKFHQVAACLSMSHTYMVFSLVLGFIYRAFGLSSSATFGIAGLLCTLLPIYSGLRTIKGKSAYFAPLMATLIGTLLLGMWGLIMLIEL